MSLVPLPDGCTFDEWSALFKTEYELDGIPQGIPWNEFAERVQDYDSVPELPNPAQFDDWREWARRAMTLLG